MYIDITYIILVLPAFLFSLIASFMVKSTFNKYSKQTINSGMSGSEAARRVLDANGLRGVKIERIVGKLTDHYDPKTNTIRLSESVYESKTAAAVGVAAHEAGHAVQHAVEYTPIKLRSAIIPITNIGSGIGQVLFFIGLFLTSCGMNYAWLAYTGLILFATVAVFQIVTLPTEFNASRRAIAALTDCNVLTDDELKGSKKVLSAAAMTYIAALSVILMTLLRFVILINNANRRR